MNWRRMKSVRSDWIDEGNPKNPLQKVWQQKFVHQEKECNLRLWFDECYDGHASQDHFWVDTILAPNSSWHFQTQIHPRSEEYVQTEANTTPPTKLSTYLRPACLPSYLPTYQTTCHSSPKENKMYLQGRRNRSGGGLCLSHWNSNTIHYQSKKPKCLCFPEVTVKMHMVFSCYDASWNKCPYGVGGKWRRFISLPAICQRNIFNLGQVASAPSQVAWCWPSAPAETKAEATPKPVLKITDLICTQPM